MTANLHVDCKNPEPLIITTPYPNDFVFFVNRQHKLYNCSLLVAPITAIIYALAIPQTAAGDGLNVSRYPGSIVRWLIYQKKDVAR
jgi:hypothetical protein